VTYQAFSDGLFLHFSTHTNIYLSVLDSFLDFVKLVVLSILIASPFTWWGISQWLQKFAYKTTLAGRYLRQPALALFSLP